MCKKIVGLRTLSAGVYVPVMGWGWLEFELASYQKSDVVPGSLIIGHDSVNRIICSNLVVSISYVDVWRST